MTRDVLIAAGALVVLLAVVGLAVDRWLLELRWWPLVGRSWRAEREPLSPPPPSHLVFRNPSLADLQYATGYDGLCPGGRRCARGPEAHQWSTDCEQDEGWSDEWDRLDPDTQAQQLIDEWHAPALERPADTDAMEFLSDADLLLWDCRRQADRIREVRGAWRVQMARLLAEPNTGLPKWPQPKIRRLAELEGRAA